jgi:phosphatidylinositol kinase/protein kinase (PI-3  family)
VTSDDQTRRYARKLLGDVHNRLHGVIAAGMPLGVLGQVQELLRQATSLENLSQMYEGWMPYI